MQINTGPAALASNANSHRSPRGHVLLIDDDADEGQMLTRILDSERFAVLMATDGLDGLRQLHALLAERPLPSPPCVILLDWRMRGLDARAFRDAQLADPFLASVPVVILSTVARDTVPDALGAIAVLQKPIDGDRLRQILRELEIDTGHTSARALEKQRSSHERAGAPRPADARRRGRDDRAQAQWHLQQDPDTLWSMFEHAPIGMAVADLTGGWLRVNDALSRITGYSADNLMVTTLSGLVHPEDADLDANELRQLLAGDIFSYHVEKRYRHAWGHYIWLLSTVSVGHDAHGNACYLITQAQDISERKELARRLEYLVDHDFLTGMYNRRRFEEELTQEADRAIRYGSAGAVLMIDLDNFKAINDAFGHRTGDDLLKGVAALLKERLRQTDVLARIGGDEFAVILPHTDAADAHTVAEEIVKAFSRQAAVLADQSIPLTASVGLAMFNGLNATEVLAYADIAMYEAKTAGRNRVVLFRVVSGRPLASTRVAQAEQIRQALQEDRFLLYGQPIMNLHDNRINQYELLLRLPDGSGGEPLPPSAFLYMAERFGLIQAIDRWVVRKAIDLIAAHRRAGGPPVILHANLSAKSLGDLQLARFIVEALAASGVDPAELVFELTETAAIANIEEARTFASRLRSHGCGFALDDFGAGFGSFVYLKKFPFDYLKIDGDFIRGLAGSPVDQLVVQAIVSIARGLGKKTVAEFVAEQESVLLLRTLGVDCAQGFHIGRPQPINAVLSGLPS